MSWKISLAEPDLEQAELDAVTEVIRSRWLTMGERTAEFEDQFARFVGSPHAVAVNSCTAALHLALLCAGVRPGDEVLCPSLTFVASANAIRYCGATPVFADVASLECWNVDRWGFEAVLTAKTKAIIVVHYGGYPCDMLDIVALATARGLAVIEDAAHAPGATLRDRALGTWGDVGCFSFFSNKNMTTGEGGMLTTANEQIAAHARRLRSHGMTSVTLDRHRGHASSYDVVEVGYNYRMTELNAVLGLTQLVHLVDRNKRRGSLVNRYRHNLNELRDLIVPFRNAEGEPAYHLMPVLLPESVDRVRVMEAMKARGIQTSIHYPSVDSFTAYRSAGLGPCDYLHYTHTISRRGLTLPLYPRMDPSDVDDVCQALASALR